MAAESGVPGRLPVTCGLMKQDADFTHVVCGWGSPASGFPRERFEVPFPHGSGGCSQRAYKPGESGLWYPGGGIGQICNDDVCVSLRADA